MSVIEFYRGDCLDALEIIQNALGEEINNALLSADKNILSGVSEIRIRKDNYLILTVKNTAYFLEQSGRITDKPNSNCIICSGDYVDKLFFKFCDYSLYSKEDNIRQGFITLSCGARVGIAGSAVLKNGSISTVKDVSSLIIRIPREIKNCSKAVLNSLYKDKLPSIIVAGAPGSGKTTLLRDLAYNLSNGFNAKYRRVVILDEREELSCFNEVPVNCDILTRFPKLQGIEIATRTLSPDIIVCDEVSDYNEVSAISYAFSSGVSFILSIHIGRKEDIYNKKLMRALLGTGEFSYIVMLDKAGFNYEIIEVSEVKGEVFGARDTADFYDSFGRISV